MNRKFSILLVEDDPNDVFFLSEAIRRSEANIPLEVVHDGQAAINFLQNAGRPRNDPAPTPCMVLLDLNLPHKSGLEVLKWIRGESFFKTILVVVLTSSTSASDMHQAYSLGANSYVVKPTDATRLREFSRFLKEYWFGWNQLPPLPDETAIKTRL